jgi:hypothetical protein
VIKVQTRKPGDLLKARATDVEIGKAYSGKKQKIRAVESFPQFYFAFRLQRFFRVSCPCRAFAFFCSGPVPKKKLLPEE